MPEPPQDLTPHEREEGLGRRVRRFVQTELGRALDKGEQRTGAHRSSQEDQMGSADADRSRGSVEVVHDPVPHEPVSHEPVSHEPVPEPHARHEETGGRTHDQKMTSAERVGLLNDTAVLREQWRGIQATFVDDPQQAVDDAGRLVDRTLDQIRANVGSARASESMSTEDLRISFQRYHELFERLLSA